MVILSCLIWGILCFVTVISSLKWYLPKLRLNSDNLAGQEEFAFKETGLRKFHIAFLFISVVVAMICGFISYNRHDSLLSTLKMILALCTLNVIAITDIELYKIPNLWVLILFIGRCLSFIPELIINDGSLLLSLINSMVAGTVCLLFLFIVSKITQGGIGYGDVKLFGALGFLCGVRAVVYILILSFFLCAIISIALLITKKKHLKDGVPMGPFVWLGFAATIILGLC